jgi:hyperosmotically inducible periplasmic protein
MHAHNFIKSVMMTAALCLGLSACSSPDATQDSRAEMDSMATKPNHRLDLLADEVTAESGRIKAQLSDALITTKIKAAFLADTILGENDIQVSTLDGVVTLTGDVQSLTVSERASEISRNTLEVKQVSNALTIKT